MWARLNTPGICELVQASTRPHEREVLASIIAEAAVRPWAHEVAVVTSLGSLYFTARLEYGDQTESGQIHIELRDGASVVLSYVPPLACASDSVYRRSPDEVLPALELLIMRMMQEREPPSLKRTSLDNDQKGPWFDPGDNVRVILNERNRTAREGVIADRAWHHNKGCWAYFISSGGRPVKKRYWGEDLERIT